MEKNSTKGITFAKLFAFLGAVVMIVSVFLPYASATDKYRQNLDDAQEIADSIDLGELDEYNESDIKASEMKDVSLFKFIKMYYNMTKGFTNAVKYTYVVLLGGILVTALLAGIFALAKKATPIVIFSIISFIGFWIMHKDFTSRGVVPSSYYNWGTGYFLFFAGFALAIIAGIALFVLKVKNKKESKLQS